MLLSAATLNDRGNPSARQRVEGEPCSGDERRLIASGRPNKTDVAGIQAGFYEGLGYGDPRIGVASSAATGDKNASGLGHVLSYACPRRATLTNRPLANSVVTRLEPPADTNGSGSPVIGIKPNAIPMFKDAWVMIQMVRPEARMRP